MLTRGLALRPERGDEFLRSRRDAVHAHLQTVSKVPEASRIALKGVLPRACAKIIVGFRAQFWPDYLTNQTPTNTPLGTIGLAASQAAAKKIFGVYRFL